MPRPLSASYADPDRAANGRRCDHPGCAGTGEFRAPRSRSALHDYLWFCLDHVRLYNASWNYYAGMTPDEIEHEIRCDTVWQRPSWPLGSRTFRYQARFKHHGMFDLEDDEPVANGNDNGTARHRHPASPEARALAVFDLNEPISFPDLKARYKELVKQNHPDAHGGDKAAEERLKVINQAYSTLKACYTS
ncbi:MAG: J domain-containing protein [Alphaproteobacteria bacterium]|nr:J domain-containing protein [Alphaproteobacteria bacterium]